MKNFKEINRTFTVKTNSIFNAVCKTRYLALLVVLIFTCGNVWGTDVTGTINFGSASGSTNINAASVTGDDSQDNTWTVTTVGTTSFTPNASYAQVGSSSKPATSITFTTTLESSQTITSMSAKFGGFSNTAGTVTLKVGDNSIGTGSLSGTSDVTVNSTDDTKSGTVLTVTVTGISKGVKCYYISYTYSTGGGGCDKKVTISKGTPETGGSFDLDKTGEQDCCSALTVTVSNITAPNGKRFSAITQTGIAAGNVTIDQNAKTVTYAANSNGSSTINVTFESKGCTDHGGTDITTGNTTGRIYGPVDNYYKFSTRQILYTKTDLGLAAGKKGTIKSIYFQYAYGTPMTKKTDVKIYMANTALASLSSTNYVSTYTKVYEGPLNCSGTVSGTWNEFEITPFEYNGLGNLVVIIDDNSNAYDGSDYVFMCNNTGSQIYTSSDSYNEDPAPTNWNDINTVSYRPNTKFCIQEADMTPSTVTLMDDESTLTEAAAGAGVTLPSRASCTGYTFAGWTKSWTSAQSSWTTTAPTIIPAGNYIPAGDESLYPVYTKTEGGGDGFKLSLEYSSTEYYIAPRSGSNAFLGATTNAAEAEIFYIEDDDLYYLNGETKTYVNSNTNTTSLTFVTSDPVGWTITNSDGVWTFQSKGTGTRHLAWNYNSGSPRFSSYTGSSTYLYQYTMHSLSTTSYISVPNCCTQLGTINGSFSLSSTSNTITATVTTAGGSAYGDAAHVSGYEFRLYTAASGGSASQTHSTNSSAGTSYTFEGLSASTNYWVTVRPIGDGTTYCNTTAESDRVQQATAAAACSSYSFNYGPLSGESNWETPLCFEFETGTTDTYYIKNFTIPTTATSSTQFYVGWQGVFQGDNEHPSYSQTWNMVDNNPAYNKMRLTLSLVVDGSSNRDFVPVLKIENDNVCGLGAQGTLKVCGNHNNNYDNKYVGFIPAGYALNWGPTQGDWETPLAFTAASNNIEETVWTTDIITLTSTRKAYNYYVGLKTASGNVYSGRSTTTAISGMPAKTGSSTWASNGVSDIAADTRGKFRVWADNNQQNWNCHFVPYYHVTYNGNGATEGATTASADVSCEGTVSQRTVKAAANGFTAPAHTTFGGWATSASGAKVYDPNDDIVLTADVELFAVWTPEANATITLNNYTGSAAPTDKYAGDTWSLPSANTYTCGDKTFVGWSTVPITTPVNTKPSSNYYEPGASVTLAASNTFYAVFADGGYEYNLTPAASLTAGSYVIAAYDDTQSKYLALTGAVSAASLGSNSDLVNETTGFTISEGKFTTLPTGACEFVLTAYTGETDNGFYIQNPADDKYLDYSDANTNRRLWYYAASDYEEGGVPTTPWAAWYGIAHSKDGFPDNGMYLKYVDETYSLMSNASGTTFVRGYKNDDNKYKPIYLFKKTGSMTDYATTCASCETVTVSYTAAPTGGTVGVKKGATDIAPSGTVNVCGSAVALTVTLTPAEHYTATGLTATLGSTPLSPTNVGNVYTVTLPADAATSTLYLTPTFTEDAHIAITWNVNGAAISPAAAEGLTWVYSGGSITALPDASLRPVPAGCSGTKVFAGWSQKHSDATEQDAAWYDDLFDAYDDPTVPTGITTAKTFYAVFATEDSNPLAGEKMWAEDFSGFSADDVPNTSYGSAHTGTTVYNSGSVTYACTDGSSTNTKIWANSYAGGTSPELMVGKNNGVFTVSNIPTAGQTTLTLTYKTNGSLTVASGTSGVTIGDPSNDGNTYTRTITINQSPAVNNFSLSFTTGSSNSRLDDIHLVVPGSSSMTDYVTLCAASYTITYNKNTSDEVTNLPNPTSVLQSTGSGTLSSTIPVRATYTFDGWSNTSGDGNTKNYDAGGSITGVSADKTIYAVWTKTPVEELTLNYTELNKYVGDASVTLAVTGVSPEGADPSVTWSSSNNTVASVVAATGVVSFSAVGTATITATSTVTGTTTALCYVTVRNKPTATFHDLIHDGNGTDLDDYYLQDVAGTAIVFPALADYATPGEDCDTKHYVFVGWTTSDNNEDPEDHLVSSGTLEDDVNKEFYAVWADGVEGYSYEPLTTNSFKGSPTKYVIGAIDGDDTYYFYSCASTDQNNGNGGCTNAPGTNAPIQFTLSGSASALVATSSEATARYLKPLTEKNFQMSATSKTVQLNADGTIANPSADSWTLRFNTSENYLRWYNSATGNAAYFYEVTAGATVSYRTSCCTNNVPAPTVTATSTAYTATLTWAAVDGATGYEVSWNNGAWTAATSPVDKTSLTASTTYTYKVRATYDPEVKCGALVASGNVTTDDVYTVTYQRGSGTGDCNATGTIPAVTTYEASKPVTLVANPFSLSGNIFSAWSVKDANDNVVAVNENQFTMPASNVTVTATWTPRVDKYYDLIHDQTETDPATGDPGTSDGLHYYITREGCNYTVPSLSDDDSGSDNCHATHEKLLGWIAQSNTTLQSNGSRTVNADCINPDGTIKTSVLHKGGTSRTATGATYYAIWAVPVIE